MGWDERAGATSRAFEHWSLADRDVRSYLHLSALWAKTGYEELWKRAERSLEAVFDPDVHYGDEHVSIFDDSVNGLWPSDYEWMLQASALKEAVTAFEVYAERSLEEVLSRFEFDVGGVPNNLRIKVKKGQDSAGWRELVNGHSFLGCDIAPDSVRKIRELRHFLVHRRGEIRTEEQRLRFRDETAKQAGDDITQSYVGGNVLLGQTRVLAALNELAVVVRSVDRTIWDVTWGKGNLPAFSVVPAWADLLPG